VAEAETRQPLREALQGCGGLDHAAQQRRLASVVERIDYDSRCGEALVCWRAPLMDAEPVSIPIRTHAGTQQSALAAGQIGSGPRGAAAANNVVAGVSSALRRTAAGGNRAGLCRAGATGRVSRARITQIMSLRKLAPAIQERILSLPAMSSRVDAVNERLLREVAQQWDWREQMRMWEQPSLRCPDESHFFLHSAAFPGLLQSL